MLISVLIPLYNKEAYIERTVFSVIAQSFKSWELIIVNDGSTDSSLNRVLDLRNSLSKDIADRVLVISQQNMGQSHARHRALREANGDFIALLDGDDIWHPKKLEIQLRFLASNPEIDLVLANYCIFPEKRGIPKAVKFTPVEKKVVGWASTEYFGGLVESTGLFRAEFIHRFLSSNAPAMGGGLELCLQALEFKSLDCVNEFLCAYNESSTGWHMQKDDLVNSMEVLSNKKDISTRIRNQMKKGLKNHLFFWNFRHSSNATRLNLILEIVTTGQFQYVNYALKTIFRILMAQARYLTVQKTLKELRTQFL